MVARKTGYTNAKGEYIVFVDSDDYLPKDALETLYKEITISDADIVLSNFQYVGTRHVWKNKKKKPSVIGEFSPTEVYYHHLAGNIRHNLWSCIFKVTLFKQEFLCFSNVTNGEDLILFYQLVWNSSKISSIRAITYYYNVENKSATRRAMTKTIVNQLIMAQNFRFHYLSERNIQIDRIIKAIAKWNVDMYRYKAFKNCRSKFIPQIAVHLKIPSILIYLSFKRIVKYSLFKLGIGTID